MTDGSRCSARVQDEADDDSAEHEQATHEQSVVTDRLALVEFHHLGDPFGVVLKGVAEQPAAQADEDDEQDDHDRRRG